MFIQTEPTPNPDTMKFLPGQVLLPEGTADFATSETAPAGSLPARLFDIAGVARVFLGHDFVSVTRAPGAEWEHLRPGILAAIMDHFQAGLDVVPATPSVPGDSPAPDPDDPDAEIVATVRELLDTRVRPAVAQDGGDIVFHGFDRGVVYLHMQGACAGCPSSTMTLKMGIENLLRHFIPEVTEVRPVMAG